MAHRHFIREWRKFRGMTMEELGERIDMSAAALSRIERGEQRYHQEALEGIARELRCSPADLIMRDPSADGDTYDALSSLGPQERATVAQLIKALKPKPVPVEPHDDEAEQNVIGAMLYDSFYAERMIKAGLSGAAFYIPEHQAVVEAIASAVAAKRLVDAVSISEHLQNSDDEAARIHKEAGGLQYLADLIESANTARAVDDAAKVISLAFRRKVAWQ